MIEIIVARVPTSYTPQIRLTFTDEKELVRVLDSVRKQGDPNIPSECNRWAEVTLNQEAICERRGEKPIPVSPYKLVGGIYDHAKKGWHYTPPQPMEFGKTGHLSDALYRAFIEVHGGEAREKKADTLL